MTGKNVPSTFLPTYSILPGESLAEIIEKLGLSQADLAERTGRPKKTINEIIKGKAAITPETALQLERVLNISSSFWNSLEQNYRACLAREEEETRLEQHVSWLSNFPVSEMIKRKWVSASSNKIEQLQHLLSFFGVASPEAWNEVWCNGKEAAAFRRPSHKEFNLGLVSAWLRQGELEGREMKCAPFDAQKFKEALTEIRMLTAEKNISEACKTMIRKCAEAGVAVVLVREFPKLGVCGATRWLSADKALIQLSLFYKRDDQFWFSFFHEAGHILLHGKREIFVEQAKSVTNREEDEANKFAADLLIPPATYQEFVGYADFSHSNIVQFSKYLGISPSIVVGRLQRERHINFNERNELHIRLDWVEQ